MTNDLIEPASQGNHLYPSYSRSPYCNMSAVDIQEAFGNLLSGVLLLYSHAHQRKKKKKKEIKPSISQIQG